MKKLISTLVYFFFLNNLLLFAQSTATYQVTFESAWSEITHPVDYPSNPHWSGIVGMTHNSSTPLFELGMIATEGIVRMAQSGNRDDLNDEIDDMINDGGAEYLINGGWIPLSPDETDFDFDISTSHPYVSMTSMLAPSPDWFVGLKDLNLYEGDEWAESRIIQITMYDAGSDSGTTFTSSNQSTDPPVGISLITDGPLVVNNEIASLGLWRIERIDSDSQCEVDGGELDGGPFEFCIDGATDNIPAGAIQIDDVSGSNTQWIITDSRGEILGLPNNYTEVNFDAAGEGICYIWHLAYENGLTGLSAGNNLSDLRGCFNLSNSTYVVREENVGDCFVEETARYKVTFESAWTETTHPVDFPSNPHWSGITGMTHNANTPLFELDMIATQGIVSMAQSGNRDDLNDEIDDMIDDGGAEYLINGGWIPLSPDETDFDIDISNSHPYVSMTSMLAPSPDWFVGLKDLNLYEDDEWADSRIIQFAIYDAGSDSGTTFTSSNQNTDPREDIYLIDDGPLVVDNEIASLGLWRFERIDSGTSCEVDGGEIDGGPFEFDTDGTADFIPNGAIDLNDNSGENSQWIITDDRGFIIDLPNNYTDFNFDNAGEELCFVWHLSYEDGIDDLAVGKNLSALRGCFNLSNSSYVVNTALIFADIDCSNLTITVEPGIENTTVTWEEPTMSTNCTDNVGNITQVNGPSNGSSLPVGITTIEYMYETGCGINPNCITTINIEEEELTFTLNCPDNIEVDAPIGAAGMTVEWDTPEFETNCALNNDDLTQTSGPTSGSVFNAGTTTIEYSYDTGCDENTDCSFEVTVNTETAILTLDCPDNITVNTPIGATSAIVQWDEPNANSNCSISGAILEQTSGLNSGDLFPIGISTITYQADDGCNNNQNCAFEINVVEQEAILTLECPDNITVNTPIGATSAIVQWDEPNANSNCSISGAILEQTSGLNSGDLFPIGISTITYQADDGCNNNQNCTFEINVVEQEAILTLECPDNITVNTPIGATSAIVQWDEPNANSNCSISGAILEQTSGLNSGDLFPIGISTITYQADDGCNNNQDCTFEINVVEQEAILTLECPDNITVNTPIGATSAIVQWDEPNANSNCSISGAILEQTSGLNSGDLFPIGISTITYQANDGCNNNQDCTFEINVVEQEAILTLECPDNITVNTPIGATSAIVQWDEPNANSNCSISGALLEQTSGLNPGDVFPIGTSTITYQANDGCNNNQDCTFEINVVEQEAILTLECPDNITVNTPIGATSAIVQWNEPNANSNCSISGAILEQTSGLNSGDLFPIGISTITYQANDGCNNNQDCTFEINVVEQEAILTLECPDNITVSSLVGSTGMQVNWEEPNSSSNCSLGGAILEQTQGLENGVLFPVGITTISYQAQDGCENNLDCSFEITVTQEPLSYELNCSENLVLNAPIGATGMIAIWPTPTASTNCEIATDELTQTSGPTNGSFLPIGTTLIEYTYATGCEESITCSFEVTVNGQEAILTLECPDNIVLNSLIGSNGMNVSWEEPIINSDCSLGAATFSQSDGIPNGNMFPVGTSMVTYEGQDPCGNATECSFSVLVEQDQLIIDLECPENMELFVAVGETGMIVEWPEPEASSNCQVSTTNLEQVVGPPSGSFLPLGTTIIEYNFDSGCEASLGCGFEITITVDSTTSTFNPALLKQQIQIYPNPADQIVNVDLQELQEPISEYEVYNTLGQKVSALVKVEQQDFLQIKVHDLSPAVYLIALYLETGERITKPFIIQRRD